MKKSIREYYEKYKAGSVTLKSDDIESFFNIDQHRKEKETKNRPDKKIKIINLNSLPLNKEVGTYTVLTDLLLENIKDQISLTNCVINSEYDNIQDLENILYDSDKVYLTFYGDSVYLNVKFYPETVLETDGEVIMRIKNTILSLESQEKEQREKIDSFIEGLSGDELELLKEKLIKGK